jgi:nicotinamide-nucleotide amidase
MMLPELALNEAETLLAACRSRRIMLVTAESFTGGLIAAALTAIAGSSDVVDRGFVAYSNDAKNQMIGVPVPLIETHGAVSEQVAAAMADGAPSGRCFLATEPRFGRLPWLTPSR